MLRALCVLVCALSLSLPASASPVAPSSVNPWAAGNTATWLTAARYAVAVETARARPKPRPPHTTRISSATHYGGSCGGWQPLVASLWPASQVGSACRVLMCESQGNPSAYNHSGAAGIFQLLGHQSMFAAHGWSYTPFDPYRNAVVAHDLWVGAGWSPWVCRP